MDKGVVNVAVNLGWKNVPLASMLEEKLKCPVSVLNDVDAGVYGEYSLGAGQGAQSVVGNFSRHRHWWRFCLRRKDSSKQTILRHGDWSYQDRIVEPQ